MMKCMIFGTTGLCGKAFLDAAQGSSVFSNVISVTRRSINPTSDKVTEVVEADLAKYGSVIAQEKPLVVFTSLATTRGAAGSADAFVAIDYGINMDLARAAKEAGVHTFVLVSSLGAKASSPFLYMKTKGRLEDDVIALKFPRTVIVRPGPLIGAREKPKGFLNDVSAGVFKFFHGTFIGNSMIFPATGEEVARVLMKLIEGEGSAEEPVVEIVGGKRFLELAKV